MTISLITAWAAALLTVLSVCKFLYRRRLHKFHKWVGLAALIAALAHGLVAGNPSWSTLAEADIGDVLFSWNTGTFTFILMAAVIIVWLLRKKYKKEWFMWHRLLSAALAAALICHVTSEGINIFERLFPEDESNETSITETYTLSEKETESTVAETTLTETYTLSEKETESMVAETMFAGAVISDGVYTGSGQGYRGTITVEVTVEDGSVTEISVKSEADDEQFFSRALSVVTGEIIDEQKLDVDAVSGATYSSHGIVEAVADAMSNAVASGNMDVPAYENQINERYDSHR